MASAVPMRVVRLRGGVGAKLGISTPSAAAALSHMDTGISAVDLEEDCVHEV